MSTNSNRQPRGTSNGGQFAASKNSESNIDLDMPDGVSAVDPTFDAKGALLDDEAKDLAEYARLKAKYEVADIATGPEFDGLDFEWAQFNLGDYISEITPEIWAEVVADLKNNSAIEQVNTFRHDLVLDAVLLAAANHGLEQ